MTEEEIDEQQAKLIEADLRAKRSRIEEEQRKAQEQVNRNL